MCLYRLSSSCSLRFCNQILEKLIYSGYVESNSVIGLTSAGLVILITSTIEVKSFFLCNSMLQSPRDKKRERIKTEHFTSKQRGHYKARFKIEASVA